jgi:hypothetical protein
VPVCGGVDLLLGGFFLLSLVSLLVQAEEEALLDYEDEAGADDMGASASAEDGAKKCVAASQGRVPAVCRR